MFSPVYDLATQASQISGPVCQLAFSFRVKQGYIYIYIRYSWLPEDGSE